MHAIIKAIGFLYIGVLAIVGFLALMGVMADEPQAIMGAWKSAAFAAVVLLPVFVCAGVYGVKKRIPYSPFALVGLCLRIPQLQLVALSVVAISLAYGATLSGSKLLWMGSIACAIYIILIQLLLFAAGIALRKERKKFSGK